MGLISYIRDYRKKKEMERKRLYYTELIRKSVSAAFLISLGNYALLKLGNPLGPVIFALGLLGVCYMGQNLFTGKCGFLVEDKVRPLDLLIMLTVNLVAGYLFGLLYSGLDTEIVASAVNKVESWDFSWVFFVKGILCGAIMYIAVKMYRLGTPLGIIFGVPLFIFCGFQHCIANVITMGIAVTFDWSLPLVVVGNFGGAMGMWWLSRQTDSKMQE